MASYAHARVCVRRGQQYDQPALPSTERGRGGEGPYILQLGKLRTSVRQVVISKGYVGGCRDVILIKKGDVFAVDRRRLVWVDCSCVRSNAPVHVAYSKGGEQVSWASRNHVMSHSVAVRLVDVDACTVGHF